MLAEKLFEFLITLKKQINECIISHSDFWKNEWLIDIFPLLSPAETNKNSTNAILHECIPYFNPTSFLIP